MRGPDGKLYPMLGIAPVPREEKNKLKAVWEDLTPGTLKSVHMQCPDDMTLNDFQRRANSWARSLHGRITTRTEDDGIRIWRRE